MPNFADKRANGRRSRNVYTPFVQVGVPFSAYQVLSTQAADRGMTKADYLRSVFPAEQHEHRLATQTHVAQLIADGASITSACRSAGVSRDTFEAWRRSDDQFVAMLAR